MILNYNGADLLPKCLPSIVEASRKAFHPTKLTLLDNQSQDRSAEWAVKQFPEIDAVTSPRNLLLVSFNDYLKQADEDIAILMNNDIRVDANFVDPLVQIFEKNPDAFLASPRTFSFDGSRYEGGRTKAKIKAGFFWSSAVFPGYEAWVNRPGYTFASGFGAFHRKRFLELGGYDDLYLPGILEDADLGFRSWQQGYRSYYVPESKVFHLGQASFRKAFGQRKILTLAHRNTFLFMWKNLSDFSLGAEHFLFLVPRIVYAVLTGKFEFVFGFFQALPRMSRALRGRRIPVKKARTDRELFRLASNTPGKRRYLFKKKWKRIAAAAFDTVGSGLARLNPFGKKAPPEKVKRILVIRADSLGDAVLTLPAIQSLKHRFPEARMDFVVSPAVRDFYTYYFPSAKLHLLPELNLKHCLRLKNEIKKVKYELAVDFRGDVRTLFLAWLAGIPHRWGRDGTGGGFLLTHKLKNPYERHEILENLALTETNEKTPPIQFPPLPDSPSISATLKEQMSRLGSKKKIFIHIGAGYPSKRWPASRFIELAKQVQEKKMGVPIFIGSAEEKRLLEPYRARLGYEWLDLAGKTTLPELLGLVQQADLFIGNDSGPAHLAALMNRKLLVIFSGTNDYRHWAPWSSRMRMVNRPVPCSPCEERVCPLQKQICLENISTEEVLAQAEALLCE